jgi:hypothetical protein
MLSLTDQDKQNSTTEMSDMSASPPFWFTEASYRRSVRWSAGHLPEIAANRVEASHFLQDGTVLSGFDEGSLPQLPENTASNLGEDPPADKSVSQQLRSAAPDF